MCLLEGVGLDRAQERGAPLSLMIRPIAHFSSAVSACWPPMCVMGN